VNCYYHPDREVVGMCVSCGKPICIECKVISKDDKIYCNQCIINEKVTSAYEKASWSWWLLPTLLGIIGGIIAYLATKNKTPIRSRDYLIVSVIVTLWVIFLSILPLY
jgi:hypothetical protein